jgi:hypothetical protein
MVKLVESQTESLLEMGTVYYRWVGSNSGDWPETSGALYGIL